VVPRRRGQEGIYFGQCTELCGKDHAYMPITVKAVTPEDYDRWLEGATQGLRRALPRSFDVAVERPSDRAPIREHDRRMTDTTITEREHEAGFGDYFALLKPRVMSLVVFTALVGLLVAPVRCTR
jgi:hypothetical protein